MSMSRNFHEVFLSPQIAWLPDAYLSVNKIAFKMVLMGKRFIMNEFFLETFEQIFSYDKTQKNKIYIPNESSQIDMKYSPKKWNINSHKI